MWEMPRKMCCLLFNFKCFVCECQLWGKCLNVAQHYGVCWSEYWSTGSHVYISFVSLTSVCWVEHWTTDSLELSTGQLTPIMWMFVYVVFCMVTYCKVIQTETLFFWAEFYFHHCEAMQENTLTVVRDDMQIPTKKQHTINSCINLNHL